MKILMTGSSGLVGSALIPVLREAGHEVTKLVRSAPKSADEVQWDPQIGIRELTRLEGMDAVIHLAGENIAAGRWNADQKARIRESRVRGTQTLCHALTQLALPPKVLLSASALGFYGDRGEEVLSEESAAGRGFLSEVCVAWEAATQPAEKSGLRVVLLRIGIVLSPTGGPLAKMALPFKLGLGGVIGSGQQYMSWIALDDLIGAITHALTTEAVRGPLNCVAPHPVTNREFTKTLGGALRRPTIFPVPAFVLRLMLGEMADELLLSGARLEPKRLLETQFQFRYPRLDEALGAVLGKR
ncbi:MAG: TIGR01777 family protein [Deltaproteobacteria bacterium]|nr:TIGR01777 family protein [Deltaproteobacteria bacterium]